MTLGRQVAAWFNNVQTMNRLPFKMIHIWLVMFAFCSITLCQTNRSTPVIPCPGDDSPGRPTLKRRQPIPDEKAPAANVDKNESKEEPCEPVRNETKSEQNQTVAKVYFEGLKSISELDVLHFLREKGITLPKDPALEPDLIRKAEETIKQFLADRGYARAAVSSRIESLDSRHALTFLVSEGLRLKIVEIRFEGNKIFSSQLLTEEMMKCLPHFEESGQEGYDAQIFDYCLHRLNNFVRSQGYLQGSFRDPKFEESNGGLVATLYGSEGALYCLGRIEFEGSSLLSSEQMVAILAQKRGDVANSERLSKFLYEELKEYYGDRGYIEYTAEVTPEFKLSPGKSEGIVDFEITIDEGRRFRVRRVDFKGANLPTEELRQLLLLKNGDIYSNRLFEETIRRLNDTGQFYEIDKDKDADFRTNEEEGLVDITLKLTRRVG